MLPSKENARKAQQYLEELSYGLPLTDQTNELGQRVRKGHEQLQFLTDFLKAATGRLPTEASIQKDRERGKMRRQRSKKLVREGGKGVGG